MTTKDDQLLSELALKNWIILGVMLILSLFWRSWPVTLGVLLGGMLVIINFRWLNMAISMALTQHNRAAVKKFRRNYVLRLLFIASALYLFLVRGEVHPLALIAGLSVVVINLMIVSIRRFFFA